VENAGSGGAHAAPIASLCIEKYIKGHVDRKAIETKWMNKGYPLNIIRTTPPKTDASKTLTAKKDSVVQKVDEELFLTTPQSLPLIGAEKPTTIKIPMKPKR
jgi:penicillin-binding protein 2